MSTVSVVGIPPEVLAAIEMVVERGATAKVSVDRNGVWHVKEEKTKKVL